MGRWKPYAVQPIRYGSLETLCCSNQSDMGRWELYANRDSANIELSATETVILVWLSIYYTNNQVRHDQIYQIVC